MTEHIKPLTSMRGIAALLVVLHHFFYYLLGDVGKEIGLYTEFFFNGYLWVDFFFILSGFIMAHVYLKDFSSVINRRNYKIYLFSRFARIYPLHLFTIFLFIGLELTKGSSAFTGSQNLPALFSNLFLLQAFDFNNPPWFGGATYWNQPSWSISAEWIAYLFLPLLLFLLSKIRKMTAVIVYLSALFCLFFLVKLTYGHLNFIGVHSIIRCILESTLGIITYQVYKSKVNRRYLKRDWIFIISLIGVFLVMHYNWNDVLIIPIFCLMILSASINNGFVAKILSSNIMVYLGAISYSIYMVHWFIQELIKQIWKETFDIDFASNFTLNESWIILSICFALVIFSAVLTYNFVETPMRNKLKLTTFAKQHIYSK